MLTASIVIYKQDLDILKKTIESFLLVPSRKKLFLIDNSSTKTLINLWNHEEIEYIFVGKNIGFGKAHNLILHKVDSKYHLILNPDVSFKPEIIQLLITQLEINNDITFITPKVIYPNGSLQYVCRKHPTFLDLLNRKLNFSKQLLIKNECQNQDLNFSFHPEFIHGCFMLFKTKDFKFLNGFDERFFLYMEDADICRRIEKNKKKIFYYPYVQITHLHQRGSSKNIKLFFYHFSSAIKYFLKWGF